MGFWDDLSRFSGNLTGGLIGESDEERKRRLKQESFAGREQREKTYTPSNVEKTSFDTNYRSKLNDLIKRRYSYDEISKETGLDKGIVSKYGNKILGDYWDEQEEVNKEQTDAVLSENADLKKRYEDYLGASAWKQRATRQQLERDLANISSKGSLSEENLLDINKNRFLENLIHSDLEDEKSSFTTVGADILDALKSPFENLGKVGYQLGNLTFNDEDISNRLSNLRDLYQKGEIDARTLQSAYDKLAGGDRMSWLHNIKSDEKQGLREADFGEKVAGFAGGIFETGGDASVFLPMKGVTVDIPKQFTKAALASYARQKATEGAILTSTDFLSAALRGQPMTVQETAQSFLSNTVLDFLMDSAREFGVAPIAGKAKGILSGVDDNGNAVIPRLLSKEELSNFSYDSQKIYLDALAATVDPDGLDAGIAKLVEQYPGKWEEIDGQKVYIKGIGERLQDTKSYSLNKLRKDVSRAVESGELDLDTGPEITPEIPYGKIAKRPPAEPYTTPPRQAFEQGVVIDSQTPTNFTEAGTRPQPVVDYPDEVSRIEAYKDPDYNLETNRANVDPETNRKPFYEMGQDIDNPNNPTYKTNKETGEMVKLTPAEAYLDYLLTSHRYPPSKATGYEKALLNELSDYMSKSADVQAALTKSGTVSDAFQKDFIAALEAKRKAQGLTPLTRIDLDAIANSLENYGIPVKKTPAPSTGKTPAEAPVHRAEESTAVTSTKTKGSIDPQEVIERLKNRKAEYEGGKADSSLESPENSRLAYADSEARADIKKTEQSRSNREFFAEKFKDQPKNKIAQGIASQYGVSQQVVARLIKKMDGNAVEVASRLQEMKHNLDKASNKDAYATSVINKVVEAGKNNPTLVAMKTPAPADTSNFEVDTTTAGYKKFQEAGQKLKDKKLGRTTEPEVETRGIDAKKFKTQEEFVEAHGKTYYRGQSSGGDDISHNDTRFQGNAEGGVFFTPIKGEAQRFGELTDRVVDDSKIVTVKESDALQKMATDKVNQALKSQTEVDDVIEQMALGRPKAFAEYTGKPFVETGDEFGVESEAIYYKEFDKNPVTTKQLSDIYNKAHSQALEVENTKAEAPQPKVTQPEVTLKDGKGIAKFIGENMPSGKETMEEVGKKFDTGRETFGEYVEQVTKAIDKEVGWDRFYDEIYYHSHPDKNLRKPISKEVADLYNKYFRDVNEYFASEAKIDSKKDFYLPTATKQTGDLSTVYNGSIVNTIDAEDFGFSRAREYKIDPSELDKSPAVLKRYFDQFFMSKNKPQASAIESMKFADELYKQKLKSLPSDAISNETRASLKEEIQQSPDGSRTPEYYERSEAITTGLLDKTKRALATNQPINPEGKYAEKHKVKGKLTVDELSELGRSANLRQITIDKKISLARDMVTSTADVMNTVKVSGDKTLFDHVGFKLYEHAGGAAESVINHVLEYTTPRSKTGHLDVKGVKIVGSKNIRQGVEKALLEIQGAYKLSLGERNLKEITGKTVKRLERDFKLIADYEKLTGKELNDWTKVMLTQESVATTVREMARTQFIEANQRLNITDPRLKKILSLKGDEMLLNDKMIKSVMDNVTNRIVGRTSAGLMGLAPKSSLFNLVETKRFTAKFGATKTAQAWGEALNNNREILARYGIKGPLTGQGGSPLYHKIHSVMSDPSVKRGFVSEYNMGMSKLNPSVENVRQLGAGQVGALRALFDDSYVFKGEKAPTSNAGQIAKEAGKTALKIDDDLNKIVMLPFSASESLKDAVYLAGFEAVGKEKGLSGVALKKYVLENFNKDALKQGRFGAIGLNRTWGGRLLTQFAGYPLKEMKLRIDNISPLMRLSSDVSGAERIAAGKYLARIVLADSATFYVMNSAFNTTFDNVFGLQVPGFGPIPTMVKNYVEALAEQRENEEARAKAEEEGLEHEDSTYKQSAFTKNLAMFIPGGNQLFNRTGIQGLLDEKSVMGRTLRKLFPDGYIKTKREGFDRNTKGRVRFEMEQNPSLFEWLNGVLDGEYTTKNAREYFGNTDPLSGVPIIGRYFKGEHGYPVWKNINDQINKASTLEEKQVIYRDFVKRVKEDKALEKAFMESADDASRETYLKLNNKTLIHNKSELERLGEKVGLGELAKEIDAVIHGPQDSYYGTKYDEEGKKADSFIGPEKWEMSKDKTVFAKRKQDYQLKNKRDGMPLDPIYSLDNEQHINEILQIRSMPTGDDKEKKEMLRATASWYRKFEEDMNTYRQANKKYYENNSYTSKEQKRVVEYNDLSQKLAETAPPAVVQRYFDIKEKQGKEVSNAFYKANQDALGQGFDSWNRAKLAIMNKMRAIEGFPPMTLEQFDNDTYGYSNKSGSGGYSGSGGKGKSSYSPLTGVAETIGKVRPEAGSGIKITKHEVKTADPRKAFKKSRAKQTSPIRIKI